ncbi:MAG: NTP transferase domain-containing protein [Myxococcota bacterium]
MRAIIIGAGRGSRLMPTTADTPKCFAEVAGKRMLDWAIDAFRQNGIDDIVFIGGYQIESVQESNPEFTFRHNSDWPHNNILASLMYAEDLMDEPFLCCYSDVLFTPAIVEAVLHSHEDIVLGVDTA